MINAAQHWFVEKEILLNIDGLFNICFFLLYTRHIIYSYRVCLISVQTILVAILVGWKQGGCSIWTLILLHVWIRNLLRQWPHLTMYKKSACVSVWVFNFNWHVMAEIGLTNTEDCQYDHSEKQTQNSPVTMLNCCY